MEKCGNKMGVHIEIIDSTVDGMGIKKPGQKSGLSCPGNLPRTIQIA